MEQFDSGCGRRCGMRIAVAAGICDCEAEFGPDALAAAATMAGAGLADVSATHPKLLALLAAGVSAAAGASAADDFFMPTRANLLRNFSTRPPRLSMLFCVPV